MCSTQLEAQATHKISANQQPEPCHVTSASVTQGQCQVITTTNQQTDQYHVTTASGGSILTPPWTPKYESSFSPSTNLGGHDPVLSDPTRGHDLAPVDPTRGQDLPVSDKLQSDNAVQTTLLSRHNDKMKAEDISNQGKNTNTIAKSRHKKPKASKVAPSPEVGDGKNGKPDRDLATCSRLVVDHVIESMYAKSNSNLTNNTKTNSNHGNSTDSTISLSPSSASKRQQTQSTGATPPGVKAGSENIADKLTFGQIQETIIRRAVENSYDLSLTSGLKVKSESLEGTSTEVDTRIKGQNRDSHRKTEDHDKENVTMATGPKMESELEDDPYAFTDTPTTPSEDDYIRKKFKIAKINKENNNNTCSSPETVKVKPTGSPDGLKGKTSKLKHTRQEGVDGKGKAKKKKWASTSCLLPPSPPQRSVVTTEHPSGSPVNKSHGAGWNTHVGSSVMATVQTGGAESPNHSTCDSEVQSCSGESREEDGDWPDEEGGIRKSQRSNRGRKYQELIEQGYLQPAREKPGTRKPTR